MPEPTILIVGTLDTKRDELLFLRSQILTISNKSFSTKILDVSSKTTDATTLPIPEKELVGGLERTATSDRGDYVNITIQKCIPIVQRLVQSSEIHGVVSAGGSSGTSLATAIMREACPVGFPKLMVSTMASGDIKHFIQETDIAMIYSVVDIAGLNSILARILTNAAGAIAGMVDAYANAKEERTGEGSKKGKRIAITMFGVTTPAVDTVRRILAETPHGKNEYEVFVFHATGSGGLAMERLIKERHIDAVIDLTTTEVADELFGGVLSAGARRLEAGAEMGIPMLISVGACDMVNFGPKDTVPEHRRGRKLYEHNPAVTVMRTSREENVEIGRFIASKLSTNVKRADLVRVLLPLKGFSMIDREGQAFHDPAADQALIVTLEEALKGTHIQVSSLDYHINDEAFARAVVASLIELMQNSNTSITDR